VSRPTSRCFRPVRLAAVALFAGLTSLALVAGSTPAYAAGTTPQQQAAAFARALSSTSAQVTAGVLDDGGGSLASVHPTTALPPASTEKIATVGAALTVFGPAHRFTTLLQGLAPLPRHFVWKGVRPTTYAGPLVVVGGGDPSLRAAGLTSLLSVVPGAGVTSIHGGVWLDVSLFDRVRTAPGWKPEWLGTEVGPLSAFMYEQNLSRSDAAYLADPDTGNAQLIASWLGAHGVTVYGGVHVGRPSLPLQTLSTVSSLPLSKLGVVTLQDSVNTWAEMLLKDVGAADGDGSTAHGLQVVRSTVAAVGAGLGLAYDGSGLSLQNRKNAQQELGIVSGLGHAAIGAELLAELPVSCTSGTLKKRLCGLPGRVHAKTGTVDYLSALTGYVVDHAGNRLWFSVQVKGNLSYTSRNALIDRAVVALAGQ
jgi:D-alanyl-D-alanine carboxypeptidase/D-alanyl-D-alanine-endopeptidase (penicillin-binding protein 4)